MHACIVIALLVFAACSSSAQQQGVTGALLPDGLTSHRRNLLVTGTPLSDRFPAGNVASGAAATGVLTAQNDPVMSYCPAASGFSLFGMAQRPCVYISGNGLLSFGGPINTFSPASLTASNNLPLLAPFWGDADLTVPPAQATWRYSTSATSAYVVKAKSLLNATTVASVFVASWNKIKYTNQPPTTDVNTFQAAIMRVTQPSPATTYVCYFYEQLDWTTAGSGGK